jgi:hypothetical protein
VTGVATALRRRGSVARRLELGEPVAVIKIDIEGAECPIVHRLKE